MILLYLQQNTKSYLELGQVAYECNPETESWGNFWVQGQPGYTERSCHKHALPTKLFWDSPLFIIYNNKLYYIRDKNREFLL